MGTAPVHNIEGGAKNVNRPILVNNMAEAKKYFGYSDDWASFTLCEAMSVHLDYKGVGPLVLINVFDPTKAAHKESTGGTAEKTPSNGQIVLTSVTITYKANNSVTPAEDDVKIAALTGSTYTILNNSDSKLGFTAPATKSFSKWNTKADGSGTDYAAAATYTADEDLTLYAVWA